MKDTSDDIYIDSCQISDSTYSAINEQEAVVRKELNTRIQEIRDNKSRVEKRILDCEERLKRSIEMKYSASSSGSLYGGLDQIKAKVLSSGGIQEHGQDSTSELLHHIDLSSVNPDDPSLF